MIIMIIITLKFATPSEQYFDWGNNTNFIFMRSQNLPPSEQYVDRGNNINYIFSTWSQMRRNVSFFAHMYYPKMGEPKVIQNYSTYIGY